MTNKQLGFTATTGAMICASGSLLAANGVIGWTLAAVGLGLLAMAGLDAAQRLKPAPSMAGSDN